MKGFIFSHDETEQNLMGLSTPTKYKGPFHVPCLLFVEKLVSQASLIHKGTGSNN